MIQSSKSIAKELQKKSYKILEQLHDLEAPKSSSYVSKRVNPSGTLYVVLLVLHQDNVFASLLESISNQSIKTEAESFQKSYHRFRTTVEENCKTREDGISILKDGHIAALQRKHTKLFKKIINSQVAISIDDSEWQKVVQAAVAIWGDKLRI